MAEAPTAVSQAPGVKAVYLHTRDYLLCLCLTKRLALQPSVRVYYPEYWHCLLHRLGYGELCRQDRDPAQFKTSQLYRGHELFDLFVATTVPDSIRGLSHFPISLKRSTNRICLASIVFLYRATLAVLKTMVGSESV